MEEKNESRSMVNTSYGENRLDKSKELNETMTINESSRDEYTETLHNLGGN